MKDKTINKLVLSLFTAFVVSIAGVAEAVTLYSDNFDSYTAGSSIATAGWVHGIAFDDIDFVDAAVTAPAPGFDTVGNYINGNTTAINQLATFDVPYTNSGIWYLTGQLKFYTDNTNNWPAFGLRDSNPDLHTGTPGLGPLRTMFQCHPYSAAHGPTNVGVYSDWAYAGADYGVPLDSMWADSGTTGWDMELIMDYDNHQLKATLTYLTSDVNGAAGLTSTTGWLPMYNYQGHQNDLYGFDQIWIYAYGGADRQVQVDNLRLADSPPSPPLLPGDFDSDGDVDGADFVAWQTHFPTASGATLADGDADGDGDVDGADFVVWQTNFPTTPGPGATAIPEPEAMWLALLGASGFVLFRRRSLCASR